MYISAVGMCGGQDCTKYAVCENFKCKCRHGYTGDGYNKCERMFIYTPIFCFIISEKFF